MSRKKPEPKPFYAASDIALTLVDCEECNKLLARYHSGSISWQDALSTVKKTADKRFRAFDIQHELVCNSLTRLNAFHPMETAVVWAKTPQEHLFLSELLTLSDVKAFFEEAGLVQFWGEFQEFWDERKNKIEQDARKEWEQEYKPVRCRKRT